MLLVLLCRPWLLVPGFHVQVPAVWRRQQQAAAQAVRLAPGCCLAWLLQRHNQAWMDGSQAQAVVSSTSLMHICPKHGSAA